MDPLFFAQCLDQIQGLTSQISLHVLGEPLTHPDFPLLLELCAQTDLGVNLTTNGTRINNYQDVILEAKALRQVNFSLQSLGSHKDGPDQTFKHILNFCHLALEKRPELYINLRLWNLDSLHQTTITAQTQGLLEQIAKFLHRPVQPVPPGRKSRRLAGRLYLHQDTRFVWPTLQKGTARTQGFCHGLSTHIAILADGTVCPCCLDANGALALGNLHNSPLLAIIHSPQATAMRQGFARGELVAPLCQQCTYCHRFPLPLPQ